MAREVVRPRRASMREVAELAGVAMSSVSRVLSEHPDVSPSMRERVHAAVEQLGYKPDLLAQSLRRRETRLSVGTLALFVPIGAENTTCHRVRYLNQDAARYRVFVHGAGILEEPVDPGDYTNFSTRLDSFCEPSALSSRRKDQSRRLRTPSAASAAT